MPRAERLGPGIPGQDAPATQRLGPWLGSIGLHVALAVAVALSSVLSWSMKPSAVHTVEAYVVRGTVPRVAVPEAAPVREPAAVTPPAPAEARAADAQAAERRAAEAKLAEAKAAEAKVAEAKVAEAKVAEARAAEAADRRAEAKKAELARAAAKEAAAAERRRAEEEAAATARAAAARREELAREKAELAAHRQREADLARQLAAEDHANALSAREAGLLARYKAELTGRVQRAWIRPPSARAGLRCTVHVTQVPGGTVTSVVVGDCNADPAVRQSIETAVYRASPLPPPPDPSLFDRNLTLEFAPDA